MVFGDNQHIADYLDYFIDDLDSPGYSVLINGEWGTGKTWFIDEYLSQRKKDESLEIVKISLYGQNSIDEINAEIFQAIHPKKHKFKNGFISKVISSTAKSSIFGLKLDLSDFMPNGKYAFDENKEYILIFDDLERSHVSIPLLMGYLNDFVENQKQKVILIGNEPKLLTGNKGQSKDVSGEFSYENIKEKLIGKTFSYHPNYQRAISSFMENSTIKSFFQANEGVVFRVFEQAGFKNLRQINSSLKDFERLYDAIFDEQIKGSSALNELLAVYLVIDLEYKNNNFSPSTIERFPEAIYLNQDGEESDEKEKVRNSLSKYSQVDLQSVANWILSPFVWRQIIVDGYIDKNTIQSNLLGYIQGNQPDWLKLVQLRIFDETSFSGFISQIEERLSRFEYKELGEVKHIFSVMFYLSDEKVISETLDNLEDQAKKYIDHLAEQGFLDSKAATTNIWGDDSYGGYRYFDIDSRSYKTLNAYINHKFTEISEIVQRDKAKHFQDNPSNTMIDGIIDDESFDHHSLPFLQYCNPASIVQNSLDRPFNEVSGLTRFIKERYQFIASGNYTELCTEAEFIDKCLVLYRKEKENPERTISKLSCGYFEHAFLEAQQKLQSCQKVDAK